MEIQERACSTVHKTKVSIIIPVYNVEKYIRQCVTSVINQSYKNIQIILIDDGSTDNSGKICDEFSKKSDKIKVIHKINEGLSEARNTGVLYAEGDFVYYLDSDDYLEEKAIECLLRCQSKNNADIVVSNYFYTYSDHEDVAKSKFQEEIVLNNCKAMEELVIGNIQTFAWGKLIRTEIANKYRFPKGKVFEDHYWTHFVFGDAQRVVFSPLPLLHYRQRNDSISFTFDLKRLDMFQGWLNRKEFLEQKYPLLVETCLERYAKQYVEVAWLVLTRMKRGKIKAFQRLREYNTIFGFENYAEGNTKKLICALQKSNVSYILLSVWNRLVRRKNL